MGGQITIAISNKSEQLVDSIAGSKLLFVSSQDKKNLEIRRAITYREQLCDGYIAIDDDADWQLVRPVWRSSSIWLNPFFMEERSGEIYNNLIVLRYLIGVVVDATVW